ncbi:MAG TPA: 5,6-dimethylbenzimidazole synthase [Jatrophihabitans sp.]|jgi:nicotinate-nucleotide--dimethylbenzimidazole phosphoribosyltransferase
MSWPRPVPSIGDATSAAERMREPASWAFDTDTIAALHTVIDSRRDVRRYRPDPVPEEMLRDVLRAGHHAPSVGQSQPWRFIVITEQATRDRAAALADRERLRQASRLTPERKARLLDLQLDGIREAPVGIVLACDRRAAASGVLGRATFADADLWSCACAIENIWLAARAVGLGLGWVTLFEPDELADLVGIPDGVETLGWLCLGWPDERPPEPGLQRAGWSSRLDLDSVILRERWPDGPAPMPPTSHLASPVAGPDRYAVVGARDLADRLLSPPGALGVLDAAVNRVLSLNSDVSGGSLVLAAGHHPVTRYQVSAYQSSVTGDVLAAAQAGESMGARAAHAAGMSVTAVLAVPHDQQGDLVATDALTEQDVNSLVEQGIALGQSAARHGLVCLGEVGIGNTTVAAALTCGVLGLEPQEAVGLGAGADAQMLARKSDVVTRALVRARAAHNDRLREPSIALAALGGPEFALLVGVTLGAAREGTPIVLDGLATGIAALLAVRLEPATQAYLIAGQRSREQAHGAVLTELGLEPLLDLRLRAGEGVGACLAAQLLFNALRIRRETGRVRATDDAPPVANERGPRIGGCGLG